MAQSCLHILCIGVLLTWHFQFTRAVTLKIEEATNGRVNARLGYDLMLTCTHDSISLTGQTLEWYIPGQLEPVTSQTSASKYYVQWDPTTQQRKLSLTVRNVGTSDEGTYICKNFQRDGSVQQLIRQESVEVRVVQDIQASECKNEQWIPVNGVGTIRCRVSGYPSPIVRWTFNSGQVDTGGRYTYQDWGLIVRPVQKADAGRYTITARQLGNPNIFQSDITVVVFETPVITFGPTIVAPYYGVAADGWDVEIQCLAKGSPLPTIHWYRKKNPNLELQQLNPSKYFVNTNGLVGKLRISPARYQEDTDTYICKAAVSSQAITDKEMEKNMITEKSIFVDVLLPPQFTNIDMMHRSTKIGNPVTIECRVKASDPLQMQFQKWGSPLPYHTGGVQTDDPRITVVQETDRFDYMIKTLRLTITNTVYDDTWNYTCIATNPAANYTWNATISVWIKPNMSLTVETQRFGWQNNATNLTCIAMAQPHPIWSWYRRLAPINSRNTNETFRIISWDNERTSISWLQIKPQFGMERWIYDEYRCNASNDMGNSDHNIHFRMASIPGTPTVSIVEVTASSVELDVTPPLNNGGMRVEHFEIVYQGGGRAKPYGPVYFPIDSNIKLTGLMSGNGYSLQVYARSLVGLSMPWGRTITTKGERVPHAVKVISTRVSTYPYTYSLRWIVPLNGGKPIDGYRIQLRSVEVGTNWQVMRAKSNWKAYYPPFYNPNMNEYYMIDLDPNQFYQICIQAFNRIGYSPVHPSVPENATSTLARPTRLDADGNFVFMTPKADPLGRPARVTGGATRLLCSQLARLLIALLLAAYIKSRND